MNTLCFVILGSLFLGSLNPVLPLIADAGIFRHDGVYYIMGVGTSGGVYTSKDLVHWEGPKHAFSMDNAWTSGPSAADAEIHACDLVLHNGVFHLYWSVNHGPLRQIGHAIADNPAGPYREPVRDIPFDGRIDPQCFVDDDGSLYFYTVKFSLGNEIYGQTMANPWVLSGRPKLLLGTVPDSWENLDSPPNFVNEAPFVVKYRNRYYMLYNANHTSPRYGNYAIGAAVADAPLDFRNSAKYTFPVLRSNRDPRHAGIAPSAEEPEVKNCGQPNLVRGPNGIEWWLVYFADSKKRSQHIDRVHFFGKELYVEGPSTGKTYGYHPPPAMPSFRNLFETGESSETQWKLSGECLVKDGEMRFQSGGDTAIALPRFPKARHYVLETVFHYQGKGTGRLGVAAWENAQNGKVLIGLDKEKGAAFRVIQQNSLESEDSILLPSDFNWGGPHTLRVENNGGVFTVYMGAVLLNFPETRIVDYTPGWAGLFASDCDAMFTSFFLTRGWDEWGWGARGWETLAGQVIESGRDGLTLQAGQTAFKGDTLSQYEFTAQFKTSSSAGVYPVYIDDTNYLRVTMNGDFTEITATGRRCGEAMPEQSFSVRPRIYRAHDASDNGNNLRVIKRADRVILFAEGIELGQVKGEWPPSCVGVFALDGVCVFNGLTLYELPAG